MTQFKRIQKIEIAYINEKGIRRVGRAYEVSDDGEFFKVLHKAGYFVTISADQVAI